MPAHPRLYLEAARQRKANAEEASKDAESESQNTNDSSTGDT